MSKAIVLVLILLILPAVYADVVINEVLCNPAGSDTGKEFVELFNPTDSLISLEGYKLESGNGANPNDWTLEWTGTPVDKIPSKGYFLIGEANVSDSNFITALDLQNGPDAVRLTKDNYVIDVVGYGDLLYKEYYEATPAKLAKEGFSLSRTDGLDTNNNSADFHEFIPSPQSVALDGIPVQVIVTGPTQEISYVALPDDDPITPGVQCVPLAGSARALTVEVGMPVITNLTRVDLRLANKIFHLTKFNSSVFSGNLNISYSLSAGNYSLNITASDGSKFGSKAVQIEVLPLAALFVDIQSISVSGQPNSAVMVIGDRDIKTKDKATVKNIGNVPIDLGLRATTLSSGSSSIMPENIQFAFSAGFTNPLTLSASTQFANLDLASADLSELSYKFFIPEEAKPNSYTGMIFVTARDSR